MKLFLLKRLSKQLFFVLTIFPLLLLAEGSVDLYPKGAKGTRAPLSSYFLSYANDHFAYVRRGEVLSVASSSQKNAARITITTPVGQKITVAKGVGVIGASTRNGVAYSNRQAELAGPRVGYDGYELKAEVDGIYKIEISSSGGNTSSDYTVDEEWNQGTGYTVFAWDISVRNRVDNAWIKGRVFATALQFGHDHVKSKGFYGKPYILTIDGYLYLINNTGVKGYNWYFFSNNKGFVDTKTGIPTYASKDGGNDNNASLKFTYNPYVKDTEYVITNKLFYNIPARDLPESAEGAFVGSSGTGASFVPSRTWLLLERQSPDVEILSIEGTEGVNGNMNGKGAKIKFLSSVTGSYELTVSPKDKSFPERVLYGNTNRGVNYAFWDGKDNKGKSIENGMYEMDFRLKLRGGEVHLPMIDVEFNDGVTIDLVNEDFTGLEPTTVYWDDSKLIHGSKRVDTLINLDGRMKVHTWPRAIGDYNGLDTWTYQAGTEKERSLDVNVKIADLSIVSVVPSVNGVTNNSKLSYTVLVKNAGESSVDSAQFMFERPDGYVIENIKFRVVDPGISKDGNFNNIELENREFLPIYLNTQGLLVNKDYKYPNSYLSKLALNKNAIVEYIFEGYITDTFYDDKVNVAATIMREPDFTDPDATNVNATIPFPRDPYEEALNYSNSNNIKKNSEVYNVAGTFQLVKKITSTGKGDSKRFIKNDIIEYQFSIVNSGNVPIKIESFSDPLPNLSEVNITTAGYPKGDLSQLVTQQDIIIPAKTTVLLSANYKVSEQDELRGYVRNQAVIHGIRLAADELKIYDLSGTAVKLNDFTEAIVQAPAKVALVKKVVFKDANNDGYAQVGETLEYSFEITNTGGSILNTFVLTDPMLSKVITSGNNTTLRNLKLNPGQTSTLKLNAYKLVQDDIYNKVVKNSATISAVNALKESAIDISGTDILNNDTTTIELPIHDKLILVKQAIMADEDGNGMGDVGETIKYKFLIKNIGDVPIKVGLLEDKRIGYSYDFKNDTFAPKKEVNLEYIYTITEQDFEGLIIENIAQLNVEYYNGEKGIVYSQASLTNEPNTPTITDLNREYKYQFVKTGVFEGDALSPKEGDKIAYTFTLLNKGDIPLKSALFRDFLLSNETYDLTFPNEILNKNESVSVVKYYPISKEDIRRGVVKNKAFADIKLGNTEFKNNPSIPRFTIGDEDLSKDSTYVFLNYNKGLHLQKTIISSSNEPLKVGDIIRYKFVLRNTGLTDLFNIKVVDSKFGADSILVNNIRLNALGEDDDSIEFTYDYTVSRYDFNQGFVHNRAVATATDYIGEKVTALSVNEEGLDSPTTIEITRNTSYKLVKTGTFLGNPNTPKVGDIIRYDFMIENTSDVDLQNMVVEDTRISNDPIPFSPTFIESGLVARASKTYAITAKDIADGSVVNHAFANGKMGEVPASIEWSRPSMPNDKGEYVSPAPTIVKINNAADELKISLKKEVKSLSVEKFAVGDVINYEFTIANTGKANLYNIELTDAKLSNNANLISVVEMAPGEIVKYTFPYNITTLDVERGIIRNTAYVKGFDIVGNMVVDTSGTDLNNKDTTITVIETEPSYYLVKEGTFLGDNLVPRVDDVIEYKFTIVNNSEYELNDVQILDHKISANPIPLDTETIAPKSKLVANATYKITTGDIARGLVMNQAHLNGQILGEAFKEILSSPSFVCCGNTLLKTDSTKVIINSKPKIKLSINTKILNAKRSTVGDTVEFTFKVENIGHVNLQDMKVVSSLFGEQLLPQDLFLLPDSTYAFIKNYIIKEKDLVAGQVVCSALALGYDVNRVYADDVSYDIEKFGTPVIVPINPEIKIIFTKAGRFLGDSNNPQENDQIEYEFKIQNLGDYPIENLSIYDDKLDRAAVFELENVIEPNKFGIAKGYYTVTADDIKAGYVYNRAQLIGKSKSFDIQNLWSTPAAGQLSKKDSTVVAINNIKIDLVKTAVGGNTSKEVLYTFVIKNISKSLITDISLVDSLFGKDSVIVSGLKLQPYEISTYNYRYHVNDEEWEKGYVTNIARAIGMDTYGNKVSDLSSAQGNLDSPTIYFIHRDLEANDDDFGSFNNYTGGSTTSVLNNDKIDDEKATLSNINLKWLDNPQSGFTLNTDGTITVSAGVVAGAYAFNYQICNKLNANNCDVAVARIRILAPIIEAVDDNFGPFNGYDGGTTTSILSNDKINNQIASVNDLNFNFLGTVPAGFTLNANGTITVSTNVPAGIYKLTYQICNKINAGNCDEAVVTIEIIAPTIQANDDNFGPYNGYNESKTISVLSNDKINNKIASTNNVNLTILNKPTSGFVLNTDGTISIAAGIAAGVYSLTYQICDKINPGNCDTAVVTIEITAPRIEAVDDNFGPFNGYDEVKSASVLSNDKINNKAATTANVGLLFLDTPTTGITLNTDGTISILAEISAGIYRFSYQIYDKINIGNVDTAVATVVITAPSIEANDDFIVINGFVGGKTESVLANDKINTKIASPSNVDFTWIDNAVRGVTLNLDGTISVSAGVPEGVYSFSYQICDKINAGNCDTAVATIEITKPIIEANDNNFGFINGFEGGKTSSVLLNDKINNTTATLLNIDFAWLDKEDTGFILNSDGTITVSAGVPKGIYTFLYQICDKINAGNCDTAVATIEITAPTLEANDDFDVINGFLGGKSGNVLLNDKINNITATLSNVDLSWLDNEIAGFTLNADGTILVSAGVPKGIYEFSYQICDKINTANCDSAVATIEVTAPKIEANDDDFGLINGFEGGKTGSVLLNDKINNITTTLLNVDFAWLDNAKVGFVLNSDGTVIVSAGVSKGIYTFTYQICDKINIGNCDTAVAIIEVTAPKIEANDDKFGPVDGFEGAKTSSVFANDKINSVRASLSNVDFAWLDKSIAGITLNTDGTIVVSADMPKGIYSFAYQICDKINTGNCDSAVATIEIVEPKIQAIDDNYGPIDSFQGARIISVLTNDKISNAKASLANVDFTWLDKAIAGITLNTDGTIVVSADMPKGIYSFSYQICDKINAGNCDSAVATIEVAISKIEANDDNFGPINGFEGATTISVLVNDKIGNKNASLANVDFKWLAESDIEFTLNADGTIVVSKDVAAGTYTFTYQICDKINTGNCDLAQANVIVEKPKIEALQDAIQIIPHHRGIVEAINVLDNDLLNNQPIDVTKIKLRPGVPSSSNLIMDNNGVIRVLPGTRPGIYTYPYTICELKNHGNCDEGIAIVEVLANELVFPTVITPNGDYLNDVFIIKGYEAFDQIKLIVFNRWGNEVYRNDYYDNSWNGQLLNEGTYYYIITLIKDGKSEIVKGSVLVKRN